MADPTSQAKAPPAPEAASGAVQAAAATPDAAQSSPTQAAAGDAAQQTGSSRVRNRLLEIARSDNARFAALAEMHSDFSRRGELVIAAVPACYMELVAKLRDAVRAFNATLNHTPETPVPVVTWQETPNIALRDPFSGDGMRVRIARTFSQFELVLRFASRPGKADIPIIEGFGHFGKELRRKVLMRIDGWVEHGKVIFWYSLDFKRYPIDLDEVPDRIVLAVATNDHSVLSRDMTPSEASDDDASGEDSTSQF